MKVLIPGGSGFCPGVKNAEHHIFKLKKKAPSIPLYVYGYLINNRKYIAYLAGQGVKTVLSADEIPGGATVVIRTHGLDRKEETALREKYEVIDLTCAKVKKVQHEIAAHARAGFFTVIVGTKDHPETKGQVSYARDCAVIERPEDCDRFLARQSRRAGDGGIKIFLCAQTTAARELFDLVADRFRSGAGEWENLEVYDSICPVTEKKEKEALALQAEADVSFVVGDKISSNAKKLFLTLSADPRRRVFFIEDLEELRALRLPLAEYDTALLVSSASTPLFLEKEIENFLRSV